MTPAELLPLSPSADRELQLARRHAEAGRLDDAEQGYQRLHALQPDNVEALVFLGKAAHARDEGAVAVNLLSRASRIAPADIEILLQLGATYRAGERLDAARYVIERAVRLTAGRHPYARLALASLLELDQRPELALMHYYLAFFEAQRARRWTQDGILPAQLNSLVEHARRYVIAERERRFSHVIREGVPGADVVRHDRVEAALALYLEGRPSQPADPRQQAGFMYLPGVVTSCFLDDSSFAWMREAAARVAPLLDEIEQCIAAAAGGAHAVEALRLSVYQRGVLQYEARRHAPRLLRALVDWPLADVAHHGPDVDIIALAAGARLARHYGRSNARCWVVLNPLGCATVEVIVGGEKRLLAAGGALALDPSFGVEYVAVTDAEGAEAVRSARLLVLDVWHPHLSEGERHAIGALLAAVIEFDARVQELD